MDSAPRTPTPFLKSALPTVLWAAGMVATAAILVFGARAAANWYFDRTTVKNAVNCTKPGVSHFVYIQDGKAQPATISGALCDMLTIINKDPKLRVIAFGPHDRHIAYDGVSEQVLAENQSMTISLNQAGTYEFHDHVDDSSIGTFTVTSH